MNQKLRKKLLAVGMATGMIVTAMLPMSTFAQEKVVYVNEDENTVISRAGVETLPYGQHSIGAFTFTDTNLTPVKTVAGTKVQFLIGFRKASNDAGIGQVKLKVQIRDASGSAISPVWEYTPDPDSIATSIVTPELNLGYAGRRIQIWLDASSVGASNGNYRSLYISPFISYVN